MEEDAGAGFEFFLTGQGAAKMQESQADRLIAELAGVGRAVRIVGLGLCLTGLAITIALAGLTHTYKNHHETTAPMIGQIRAGVAELVKEPRR